MGDGVTDRGRPDRELLELMVQQCLADGVVEPEDVDRATAARIEGGHGGCRLPNGREDEDRSLMDLPYLNTSHRESR